MTEDDPKLETALVLHPAELTVNRCNGGFLYGRVVPNSRLGVFLGYSRSLKILYYFDLASSLVKTATHARFDEGMNDLADAPPNVQALHLLSPDGVVPAERPSRRPVPPPRLHHAGYQVRPPDTRFEISACHIRLSRATSRASPQLLGRSDPQCASQVHWAYIVSIDGISVFSCESIVLALTGVAASDAASFTIVFAPDRYIPVSARPNDSPLHLSVDQLRLIDLLGPTPSAPSSLPVPTAAAPEPRIAIMMHEPLPHDQLPPAHDAQPESTAFGTEEQALGSFTRRKLQRLSNWKDWHFAEAKQLDSMAKQEMYGPPSTHLPAPLFSASIGITPSRLTALEKKRAVVMDPLAPPRP
ncbi:hypothetical protein MHU86_4717 [Fragilaria crotonensis]|nr:hypothetical protein MHU86_4717 [Fragilaria crotonensis]